MSWMSVWSIVLVISWGAIMYRLYQKRSQIDARPFVGAVAILCFLPVLSSKWPAESI